jgi:biopolymer transport protein ExbD
VSALHLRGERRRRLPVLNVTSLIDVLFLLLIFFMVSSTFVENPAIDLDLPEASTAESAADRSASLSMTAGGEMYLDGEPVTLEALADRLQAAMAEDPERVLILEADRAVDYGEVIRVIDLAREAGVERVSAFTAAGGQAGGPAQ